MPRGRRLTDQRIRALVFAIDYEAKHGRLPGSEQLGQHLGIKDRGVTVRDMKALEDLEYIERAGPGVWWRLGHSTPVGRILAEAMRPVLANPPWEGTPRKKNEASPEAQAQARSIFPGKVVDVGPHTRVLKPGRNNIKLGAEVTLGRWRGLAIYSVTLEERATCPRTCKQWGSCYGNNMHRALRYRPGKALLAALGADLDRLLAEHEPGLLVRLHQLGDFYSIDYVRWWAAALQRHLRLHIFGYTARLPETKIGGAVHTLLNAAFPDRCFIRYSGGDGSMSAIVIKHDATVDTATTIICPEQTGRVQSCGECGLCWTMSKRVAFRQH